MTDISKRLRGMLGNALIWGGAWSVGSIVLLTAFVLLGLVPTLPPLAGVLRIAARFGLTGVAVGAGFSGFLAYVYSDQRIGSIRRVPFILAGAAVSAIVAPIAGGSVLICSLLGAGTAGLTLGAARQADRQSLDAPDADHLIEG